MSGAPADIIIFAPLAPILCVLLFWFIQLLFIESQKFLLSKIWDKHEPLCRFTNFLGILYQTICHALGFTVTRSGVSNFYVSIHYGKVSPKKEKTGIFEWMSNGFLFWGPFFLPSFLLLVCLFFLMSGGFNTTIPAPVADLKYTFAGQIITFGTNLYAFSEGFFTFLFTIDLLHPGHLGFLLLLIFLGMGIRPSYIAEKTRRKVDMLYDLNNIKSHLLHKPLYIFILFLAAYVFFYVSLLLGQNWYILFFSMLGWLSIIAIASLAIAHVLILLIRVTDEIPGFWSKLPYLTILISYILMRVLLYAIQGIFYVDIYLSLSLVVTILSTVLVTFVLLKYKTNKFKSKPNMKKLKKVEDDSRRIIKQ